MKHIIKYIFVIVTTFLLTYFLFFFEFKPNRASTNQIEQKYGISKEIKEFINKKQQIVSDTRKFGSDFTYLQAIDEGCGSCHQKWIYVFDKNNNKLFETTSDDNLFGFSTSDSFSILEPVRKEGEPLCCPTEYKTRMFNWDGKKFVETNQL